MTINKKMWDINEDTPELEIDKVYSLVDFATIVADRYNVSRSHVQKIVRDYDVPGVLVQLKKGGERPRYAVTPVAVDFMTRLIHEKLANGYPIDMAVSKEDTLYLTARD